VSFKQNCEETCAMFPTNNSNEYSFKNRRGVCSILAYLKGGGCNISLFVAIIIGKECYQVPFFLFVFYTD
jgi:hypothetical protein